MELIVLLGVDEPEDVQIAQDEHGDNLVFSSYEEADDWCAKNTLRQWVKTINLRDSDDDDE